MKKAILITISILSTLLFCSVENDKFIFSKKGIGTNSLELNIDIENITEVDGYKKITNHTNNHTIDSGFPELPTYTTFYQLDPGKEYNIEMIIHDSYIIENMKIIPYEDKHLNPLLNQNLNFYTSNNQYPENNFHISNRMPSRGIDIVSLEVIPFTYYSDTNSLEVFTNVEIVFNEIGDREVNQNSLMKRSRVMDSLLENFVINYETSSRDEDYQIPSILYICGGSSESNSYFQDLVEWRHQQGYIVNTATLSETGSSASSIKNYIQNAYYQWDNPPEYVAFVGDVGGSYSIPTFYEGWGHNSYGNDCEGDLQYSQLDGNDLIPEVIIGRLSVRSSNEIGVVVAKTIAYEKASYINATGTDWYEGAALVGDPSSSGQSTIHTNQYIDNILDSHGFDDIETAYSGDFDGFMEDQLDEGILYLNYRGYLGVSNFDSNDINGANSGYMTPFATLLTCGTGSYAEDNTCLSEAMLRYGSVSNPKGAVGAVATATWNTHTLFNNIVAMGMYDGIFSQNLPTQGLALASGKLALLHTYPGNSASSWVSAFTQWNNLMGDPAVLLWTDTPSNFNVTHPPSLTIGSNIVDINIRDNSNQPIKDAWVTILKGNDEIFITTLSDENGNVTFNWDSNVSSGNIKLTITKRNFIPYQEDITIIDSQDHVQISEIFIDDNFGGNNDGILNPGEYVGLHIELTNLDNNYLTNITGYIESDNNNVLTENNTVSFNNINSGETTGNPYDPFYMTLDYSAINQENLNIRLNLDINGTNHLIYIPIEVVGADIDIERYSTNGQGISVGELNDINIDVRNNGGTSIQNLSIELLPYENLVTVPSSIEYLFQLGANQQASNVGPFQINVSDQVISGTIVPMEFIISNSDGFYQTQFVNMQLGTVSVHEPLGPDPYGYYIYDSGDTSYELAPNYEWFELDDGLGTIINLDDDGNANGSNLTEVINLPFPFRFYGIDYNQITVAVDGYLSFGNNEVASHRNYPIPGAGGPSPMIAPFWDDLKTGSNGYVYKYLTDELVVIQWDYLRTYENNSRETFQVILYNSEYADYETITGDGEIKIQYYDFNNTSDGNWSSYPPEHAAYSTIGIENHLGDMGLEYSYNNNYPNAAMPLSDGSALFITTGKMNDYLMGDINADESINVLDVVLLVNVILNLIDASGYQMIVSDINLDGNVNVLDVVQLVNIILN
tara:strand:- start:15687 stop:19238 length:3552 start_codon:yes stop_codon:yes gene_type:complete